MHTHPITRCTQHNQIYTLTSLAYIHRVCIKYTTRYALLCNKYTRKQSSSVRELSHERPHKELANRTQCRLCGRTVESVNDGNYTAWYWCTVGHGLRQNMHCSLALFGNFCIPQSGCIFWCWEYGLPSFHILTLLLCTPRMWLSVCTTKTPATAEKKRQKMKEKKTLNTQVRLLFAHRECFRDIYKTIPQTQKSIRNKRTKPDDDCWLMWLRRACLFVLYSVVYICLVYITQSSHQSRHHAHMRSWGFAFWVWNTRLAVCCVQQQPKYRVKIVAELFQWIWLYVVNVAAAADDVVVSNPQFGIIESFSSCSHFVMSLVARSVLHPQHTNCVALCVVFIGGSIDRKVRQ